MTLVLHEVCRPYSDRYAPAERKQHRKAIHTMESMSMAALLTSATDTGRTTSILVLRRNGMTATRRSLQVRQLAPFAFYMELSNIVPE